MQHRSQTKAAQMPDQSSEFFTSICRNMPQVGIMFVRYRDMTTEIVLHEDNDLRIVQRSVLGRCVLSFHGPITFKARRPFQEAIAKLRTQGFRSLVLHLTQVTFVDSAALALITLTWRDWKKASLVVVIAHPSPQVKELLHLSNIHKLVPIFGSLQEAITSIPVHDPPATGS